jgi:hypothetical protein
MKLTSSNPIGLGDAVQKLIAAGLYVLPVGAAVRVLARGCGGCAKRKAALDKLAPNVNPFARPPDSPQPPTI